LFENSIFAQLDWAGLFGNFWPILVIGIVGLFFKSAAGKGIIGEFIVNVFNSATLDKETYQSLKKL
jgi:hypothetical protein